MNNMIWAFGGLWYAFLIIFISLSIKPGIIETTRGRKYITSQDSTKFLSTECSAHTDKYWSLLLHQPCCSIVTWCLSVPSGPFDAVALEKRLHHAYLCCAVQIYLYMQFCTHSTQIYYTCCFSFFQFILSHPAAILWTEQNLADDLFFKIKEHN